MCVSKCSFYKFCLSMSEVISFSSLKAGSQVFALLMLFPCVTLHIMWSGKSLQIPFGILCLSAIRIMFMNFLLTLCMLVVSAVSPKAELCPRLIVSIRRPTCSLQNLIYLAVIISHVNCGDSGHGARRQCVLSCLMEMFLQCGAWNPGWHVCV